VGFLICLMIILWSFKQKASAETGHKSARRWRKIARFWPHRLNPVAHLNGISPVQVRIRAKMPSPVQMFLGILSLKNSLRCGYKRGKKTHWMMSLHPLSKRTSLTVGGRQGCRPITPARFIRWFPLKATDLWVAVEQTAPVIV
jgi:hypothetical protein